MPILDHFKNITPTTDQLQAIKELDLFLNNESNIFILQGYAGTGKTTLIKGIVDYIKSEGKEFSIMAPTGRAAKILRDKTGFGNTIHKVIYNFTNLESINKDSEDVADHSFHFHFPINKLDSITQQILIIDEASMISNMESKNELFTFGSNFLLNDILTYASLNNTKNKIVFIGDPAQLPPVNDNKSLALERQYFTNLGLSVQNASLKEIKRQSDNFILKNATVIRNLIESDTRSSLKFEYDNSSFIKSSSFDLVEQFTTLYPKPTIGDGVIISFSNQQCYQYNQAIREKLYPNQPVPSLLPPPVYQPTIAPTNTPIGVNQYPAHDFGHTQDQGNTMGRWGGMKKYGPGGNQDGCPQGYYKNPVTLDCLKIFGSDQADAEYQSQVVDFWNSGPALGANQNRGTMITKDEFFKENPIQDQMYTDMQSYDPTKTDAAYQQYLNDYAKANAGKVGAAPPMTKDEWKKGTAKMPTDPRVTGNPYIVETDKNMIANIDSNWVTRTLAKASNLGDPQHAGLIGGFNPALKFLLGAGAFAGSAGLGIAKAFAGDRSRVYDDKGNVFYYNNKGDEKRALKNGPQTQQNPTQSGNVTPTPAPSSTGPAYQPVISSTPQGQYQNSQLTLPGQTPNPNVTPTPATTPAPTPAALNAVPGSNNVGPSVNNTPGPMPIVTPQSSQTGPLQSDDPYAPNYNPNVPKTIKEDGGEWNPFVDNRRKLRISMPMYGGGGPLDTETSPYTQQEWAQIQSKTFPLKPEDIQPYNDYVASFGNSANPSPANMNPNVTNNANNALSSNPSANKVDTKEYTIQRGDPLGFKVASQALQGLIYMKDSKAQMNEQESIQKFQGQQRKAGNTMAMGPINTQGSYGTWNLNAGPGANQYVADLGHTQDWGTQLSRYGGTKSYRQGGTYEVSKEELRRIIEMGGEIEFLD